MSFCVHTHFTYWLLLWYILYIAFRLFTKHRLPSPFLSMVVLACINASLVLYTIFLVVFGQLPNTYSTWLTIGVYMVVNALVKVLPILSLHWDWFNTENRKKQGKKTSELHSDVNSIFLGLTLLVLWSFWWWYNDNYALSQHWLHQKRVCGVLANDGPMVSIIKKTLSN